MLADGDQVELAPEGSSGAVVVWRATCGTLSAVAAARDDHAARLAAVCELRRLARLAIVEARQVEARCGVALARLRPASRSWMDV